jgi:hypothetical protein
MPIICKRGFQISAAIWILTVCSGCWDQKQPEPKISEAAAVVRTLFLGEHPDIQAFCGTYLSLKYNNIDAFSNQNTLSEVRFYSQLEEKGYVKKLSDKPTQTSIDGMVEYRFTPTQKFLDLMDRRDDQGCYWVKSSVSRNFNIKSEQVHPQYKTVTTVYAETDVEVSKFFALTRSLQGLPDAGGRTMIRALVIENPITHKAELKEIDSGPSGGSWSTNKVPDAILAINLGGPDAVR